MSADLYIHAMKGITEADLACFMAYSGGCRRSPGCEHWRAVANSPSVWIGEVSWLKAGLTGDDSYIPEPVAAINDLIGASLPVLDEELKVKILRALGIQNVRARQYDTTKDEGIIGWLDEHIGERLFTVSW